jgi:hypothetical protein
MRRDNLTTLSVLVREPQKLLSEIHWGKLSQKRRLSNRICLNSISSVTIKFHAILKKYVIFNNIQFWRACLLFSVKKKSEPIINVINTGLLNVAQILIVTKNSCSVLAMVYLLLKIFW